MKIDRFVIAIIITVIAAYIYPDLGKGESAQVLNTLSSIGISLIFFFYGLKLSPQQIKIGLKNWKLHLLIQATTFILFPLIVLTAYPLITEDNKALWLAFMFLAALPSTVSSSVVMVSIAKGNIPAAIFNASISGLIGVILTPLWIGLFMTSTGTDYNLIEVYQKLLLEILAPVILGLLLRSFLGAFALKHSKKITLFDKSVILLIIYKSFSKSFLDRIFENLSPLKLLVILAVAILIFWMVYYLVGFVAKRFHFSFEDRITAQFCGTKKSLVHGTVFSKILFQNASFLGIILLPIMMFHAFQIVAISVIAAKHGRRDL
ncbi:bile acid:sodium symporter family protein [Mesoflavibacter zeaxanthinifaciens]|uniref:bile acid:sodium symporter family protein n=1 Tax=Mesoflavibacter zeaxanthinifaciens TaxID=393060 RepID=UPI0026EFE2DF|nr:bile acid:sodium symporter family protein [Mesoflavibacter zeaxanthinifaciens]